MPNRVAFSLFGQEFYWYGIIIAAGVVIAILLGLSEAKRKKINQDHIIDFALLLIPLGAIGARLYYVIFEWQQFSGNFWRIFNIREGGLAIYGAVIGGIAAALIISRWRKIHLLTLLDIAAPGLVLAQGLGRWGNFFNQEAYGPLITDPNWMWFPFAVRIEATNTVHMATFFYESMWCLLVFIFLWLRRKKFRHEGDVFIYYLLFYGFERMLVEGLRQDSLWLVPDAIRVSQLLSAVLFLGALAFLLVRHMREKEKAVLIGIPALPRDASMDEPEGNDAQAEASDAGEKASEAEKEPEEEKAPEKENAPEEAKPGEGEKTGEIAEKITDKEEIMDKTEKGENDHA